VHSALALAALLAAGAAAAQQPYPDRTVTIVAPAAPGGLYSIFARVVGARLERSLGKPFIVENRPGAGSIVGAMSVIRSAPNGYTLMIANSTGMATNVSLYKKLPYEPLKDFAGVILLATAPHIVVVHPSVPAHSLKEFIDYAKSKPGALNYSSSGPAGTSYVLTEILRAATGMNLVHVPYKGGGPAMTALVAGEAQVTIAPAVTTLAQWRSQRARPLAILSADRSPLVPGIPTLSELGYSHIVFESWYGLLAPAGTPPEILSKVNADIRKAMALPDVKQQLEAQGLQAAGGSPAQFDAYMRAETEKWAKAIKAAGVPPADL
jgi:tripartite-type tricarboxylate transporter receptor subunit TctC